MFGKIKRDATINFLLLGISSFEKTLKAQTIEAKMQLVLDKAISDKITKAFLLSQKRPF
jgi:hypothetical protein